MKINKMYYKRQDLENSYFNKNEIVVTNDCYIIVKVLGVDGKTFACDVYVNNKLVNVKCFYSVGHFNNFVKYHRIVERCINAR